VRERSVGGPGGNVDDEKADLPEPVVEVVRRGDAATVSMKGDLDVSTAPELTDVCYAVYADGAREVVIDLTDTSFLDSSGLRALIGVRQLFGDSGHVRLSHPSEPTLRLLDLTGLSDYFSISED
jgi:anti-sigma B factor antagonist